MSAYQTIDLALAEWADKNSLHWYSEYQDTEVRSFVLNSESKSRVQVAVEAPKSGQTVVRVGQVPKGLSRLARNLSLSVSTADILDALDKALETANEWLAEFECAGR